MAGRQGRKRGGQKKHRGVGHGQTLGKNSGSAGWRGATGKRTKRSDDTRQIVYARHVEAPRPSDGLNVHAGLATPIAPKPRVTTSLTAAEVADVSDLWQAIREMVKR